jgi:hypothetical protein
VREGRFAKIRLPAASDAANEGCISMALPDAYVQVYGRFPEVFKRISDGQAPEKFTRQYLKDLGFRSANHHALIPLLRALGFLSADGVPTARYHAHRDKSQASKVLGQGLA